MPGAPGTRGCHDGKLTELEHLFDMGEIPGKHRARIPGGLSGPLGAWRDALRAAIQARGQSDDEARGGDAPAGPCAEHGVRLTPRPAALT